MPDTGSGRRLGDRKEGRQLRSLGVTMRMAPYFMRERSDACSMYNDTIEVTEIEQWILTKRREGWKNMSFLHLILAAYVRTVAKRPGLNRFVAGRRIFARNDLSVVLSVRRSSDINAPIVPLKVYFSPTDSVFEVYRRVNDAIDSLRSNTGDTELEKLCNRVDRLPRFLKRWIMGILRFMDYHDLFSTSMLELSPFHASLGVVEVGSLGMQPVSQHIYDFGNIPCFMSFGTKRRCYEANEEGTLEEKRYVDYRITMDERICPLPYLADSLKGMKYYLRNPLPLELPAEHIDDDVN